MSANEIIIQIKKLQSKFNFKQKFKEHFLLNKEKNFFLKLSIFF